MTNISSYDVCMVTKPYKLCPLFVLRLIYTGRHKFTWGGSYEAATHCCKGSYTAERSHCICYSPASVSPTSREDGPSSTLSAMSCCCLLCEEEGKKWKSLVSAMVGTTTYAWKLCPNIYSKWKWRKYRFTILNVSFYNFKSKSNSTSALGMWYL